MTWNFPPESLPESAEPVLVFVRDEYETRYHVATYNVLNDVRERWEYHHGRYSGDALETVDAWMPLPAAPDLPPFQGQRRRGEFSVDLVGSPYRTALEE